MRSSQFAAAAMPVGRTQPQSALRLTWGILIGLVVVAVVAPLAATRIPFVVDYPNHLARMHVLATSADSPALASMFEIHWAFIPNMVMDLIVPVLAQVMALDVAGRVFIAVAMLLPPLGVVALHRAWFGRQALWPGIAALTASNAFIFFGFLNYEVGVGLALLAAAWHAQWRARPHPGWLGGLAGAALWGIACMVSHLTALGLLLLFMASTEIGDWRSRYWPRCLVVFVVAAAVPFALYKAIGPAHSYASGDVLWTAIGQIRHYGLFSDPRGRAVWTVAAFAGASPLVGLVTAALVVLILALAAWRRRLRMAPQMLFAAACLAVGYAVLPSELADNGMVYQRLALPLTLVMLAGLWPRFPRRLTAVLAAAVLVLVVARGALLAQLWQQQSQLLAQLEQVIIAIPPGARVLAVRDGSDPGVVDHDEPRDHRVLLHTIAYQHLAALVTLERDAFEPLIFTAAGKQPVQLRPAYERDAQSDGSLPLTSQLPDGLGKPAPGGRCGFVPNQTQCQLLDWPARYDYVLRLNAGSTDNPDPARLQPVAADGWAALYRVTGPASGG